MTTPATLANPALFAPGGPLSGTTDVPGDKSISHRALMFGALAVGETRIDGLLEGEDVLATAAALRAMGAVIDRHGDGRWSVHGVGVGGLLQPDRALDMGNSGTSTRLLMGLLASHALTATFTGDASLSKRPMGRVIEPLSRMGADFTAAPGSGGAQCLPLTMRGLCPAVPISYRLPVASAQVKSAILLAGLNTPGITEVIEPVATRDHSERMLAGFGAQISIGIDGDGARIIRITGEADLRPQTITVPGDPSSAAFPMVAALIVPGSDIIIRNVGINPTRAGLVTLLQAMGGSVDLLAERKVGGEPVADIRVRHSALRAVEPDPACAPAMIDEFPVAFVAAAFAQGRSIFRGLEELRVKESDRIATMADGLRTIGARVEEIGDGLTIDGTGGDMLAGNGTSASPIATRLDHRIAMSFAIAGLHCRDGVMIDDMNPVATSFPTFRPMLATLMQAAQPA